MLRPPACHPLKVPVHQLSAVLLHLCTAVYCNDYTAGFETVSYKIIGNKLNYVSLRCLNFLFSSNKTVLLVLLSC